MTSLQSLLIAGNPELTDFQPLRTLRTAVEAQGGTVIDNLPNADVSGYPQAVQDAQSEYLTYGIGVGVDGYLLIDVDIGPVRHLEGHARAVHTVAWSPDGTLLVSRGEDRVILVWDATTGTLLRALKGHKSVVTSVAFSPNGTLASGDRAKTIWFWNPTTGKRLAMYRRYVHAVEDIAWNADGTHLATAGDYTARP